MGDSEWRSLHRLSNRSAALRQVNPPALTIPHPLCPIPFRAALRNDATPPIAYKRTDPGVTRRTQGGESELGDA